MGKRIALSSLLVFLIATPLALNLIKIANFCFNGYDLGLYHEVITDLAIPGNLNPMLSVRGIKAFNDHSNPVFIPISIGVKSLDMLLTGRLGNPFGQWDAHPSSSLVFEWLTWIAAGLIFLFLLRDRSARERWIAVLLFFSGKGVLSGLAYPVHADFMMTGAWIVLVWGLVHRRAAPFFVALTLISLSKESYPIAFVFTAAMLFIVGERRWSLGTFAIAGAAVLWNQVGRVIFLGPVHGFGERLILGVLENPVGFALDWWKRVPVGGVLEIYLFAMIFLVLVWKRDRRVGWVLAATLAPLFGLHALAGLFENHYAFWLPTAGLAALFFTGAAAPLFARPAYFRAIVGLTLLTGVSAHFNGTRFLRVMDTNCHVSADYRAEFAAVHALVEKLPAETVIGATGGVVTNLVAPGRDLRHLHSHSVIAESYGVLILEVGPAAFDYPLNPAKTRELRDRCAPFVTKKSFEGTHLQMWEGPFPRDCVYWQAGDQKGL